MTDKPKPPETPGMAEVSAKFVAEAKAAKAAPPSSAIMPDDALIALGHQWKEVYGKWEAITYPDTSDREKIRKYEEERNVRLLAISQLEDQAAEVAAQTVDGVLVQLRMAGTHYHLMERDGEQWANTYAKLTWQAWDGLERLIGTTAVQEPEIDALFDEWRKHEDRLREILIETRAALQRIPSDIRDKHEAHQGGPSFDPDYHEHYVACGGDALDHENDKVCDRISDLQIRIIKTPVKTLGGLLTKARVAWHITALDNELDKLRPKLSDLPRLDDAIFVWAVLQDAERLAEKGAAAFPVSVTEPGDGVVAPLPRPSFTW